MTKTSLNRPRRRSEKMSMMNAPVLADLEGKTDPLQIANKEPSQKKISL